MLPPKLFKISFPLINLSANFFLVIILFIVVLQYFYNDSASRCRPCVLRAVFLSPFSGEASCLLLPDHLLFNRCNIIYARVWFHYQFLVAIGISVYSAHIGLHCYFLHCYVYFSQSWRCGVLVMVLFITSKRTFLSTFRSMSFHLQTMYIHLQTQGKCMADRLGILCSQM